MTSEIANHGMKLQALLDLSWRPVAIAFRPEVPLGMTRIAEPAPAGCAYWRLAAEGKVFYTDAADHYTCPVGAHTHGVDLPPEVARELQGLVQTMVGMQYIRVEEIARLPRREGSFGVALYAPLSSAPFEADIVLVRGTVKQLMLLAEACQAAGIAANGATMGRPTCSILPQAMQSGLTAASFGCIGNRVYTGLSEEEGYYAIPGAKVDAVLAHLGTIIFANRQLETFHRARLGARPQS